MQEKRPDAAKLARWRKQFPSRPRLFPPQISWKIHGLPPSARRPMLRAIFANVRVGDYFFPYGHEDPVVVDKDGKPVQVGDVRIRVGRPTIEDLQGLPGQPHKSPYVIERGELGKQYVLVARFSFTPSRPCDRTPPFTIIQTVRTMVRDKLADKAIHAEERGEENPEIAPFMPAPQADGTMVSLDLPGPNINELKERHPDVKEFEILMDFRIFVRDNCRNEIIGMSKWSAFFEIVLDAAGNFDEARSDAHIPTD